MRMTFDDGHGRPSDPQRVGDLSEVSVVVPIGAFRIKSIVGRRLTVAAVAEPPSVFVGAASR